MKAQSKSYAMRYILLLFVRGSVHSMVMIYPDNKLLLFGAGLVWQKLWLAYNNSLK